MTLERHGDRSGDPRARAQRLLEGRVGDLDQRALLGVLNACSARAPAACSVWR
jgi:hypothetical protein